MATNNKGKVNLIPAILILITVIILVILASLYAFRHEDETLEGQADVLIFPDIETGNAVYKTLSFLVPKAEAASMLVGTTHPVVLTSRGDSIATKVNSLALAAIQTKKD